MTDSSVIATIDCVWVTGLVARLPIKPPTTPVRQISVSLWIKSTEINVAKTVETIARTYSNVSHFDFPLDTLVFSDILFLPCYVHHHSTAFGEFLQSDRVVLRPFQTLDWRYVAPSERSAP